MNTLKELFNYIDETYKKNPGEYTKDELYEIGNLHMNLDKKEKDWKALKDKVGYEGTDRSLYKLAKYRKVAEKVENEKSDDFESKYKDKTNIRDLRNEYYSDLRKDARREAFYKTLKEVAASIKMEPVKTYKGTNDEEKDKEAVLLLSDLHMGASFSNYINHYDTVEALARVYILTQRVIKYCKANDVKTLHVLNLGDLIHGSIHTTGRIMADTFVSTQIVNAGRAVAEMLNDLQEAIPEVTYRSCTDNHSRVTPNYKDSIDEENYSVVIDEIVKSKLSGSRVKFMEDNIDPSIMYFSLQNGKTFMAAHGHLEKPDKVIDNFTGLVRTVPDFVAISHFHATRLKAYNNSVLLVNGSIMGTDTYAFDNRLFNDPQQTLLIFNHNDFNNICINLK